MADLNDEGYQAPEVTDLISEIDSHTKRIREKLGPMLASANTPEAMYDFMQSLGSEMLETMLPLWSDFSKAAASEIDDLNTEVFGVKLSVDDVTEVSDVLGEAQALAVGNPELTERIERALALLDGEEPDDDDDDDETSDDGDEPVTTN